MKEDDASTRSWEAIADDWVAHADTNDYRNLFLMPRLFSFLGDVSGRRILDLGCGEGGYARELARRGAHVTAVDGSERLIEVARKRARAANVDVRHICANANALEGIEGSSFDVVVAAMSLMDVEDYDGAIAEIDRVLATGGELLMSITHPCFTTPGAHWTRDANGDLEQYIVDRYFDRTPFEEKITESFASEVVRFHRPLEDIMRPLLARNVVLREFREPAATEDDVKKSRRFPRLMRIPYFLFMRWSHG